MIAEMTGGGCVIAEMTGGGCVIAEVAGGGCVIAEITGGGSRRLNQTCTVLTCTNLDGSTAQ